MKAIEFICTKCKTEIGMGRIYKGKIYCLKCYKELKRAKS